MKLIVSFREVFQNKSVDYFVPTVTQLSLRLQIKYNKYCRVVNSLVAGLRLR